MPVTTEIVRDLIRTELKALGLLPAEKPGLPVVFSCSCPRERCSELRAIPIVVNGERRVDITIMGMGGCVLDQTQRDQLADILNDKEWFGDHADLGE